MAQTVCVIVSASDRERLEAVVADRNRLAGSKKEGIVSNAVQLLAGTGWPPAMLKVPGATYPEDSADAEPRPAAALAVAAE